MVYTYLIISVIVALIDLYKMSKQEDYLGTFPLGDLGEFIELKPVMGVHNIIFFPSLLIIKGYLLVIRIINAHLD